MARYFLCRQAKTPSLEAVNFRIEASRAGGRTGAAASFHPGGRTPSPPYILRQGLAGVPVRIPGSPLGEAGKRRPPAGSLNCLRRRRRRRDPSAIRHPPRGVTAVPARSSHALIACLPASCAACAACNATRRQRTSRGESVTPLATGLAVASSLASHV